MESVIRVIVSPIDTSKHHDWGTGYRWAVQVGGMPPEDLKYCANAGKAKSVDDAIFIGDRCAATVVTAFQMFSIKLVLEYTILDHDPIPEETNQVRVIGTEICLYGNEEK